MSNEGGGADEGPPSAGDSGGDRPPPRDRSRSRSPPRRRSSRARSRSRSYSRSRSPPPYGSRRRSSRSPSPRGGRSRSSRRSRSRSRSRSPDHGDRFGGRDGFRRDRENYRGRGPPPGYGRPPPNDEFSRRRGGPPPRDYDSFGPRGGGPTGGGGPPPFRGDRGGGGDRRRRGEGLPGVSLLVRNVSPQVTTQDLQMAFGRIGDVRDVYIPRDYHSQQPKGFAFVEYANIDMAREARDEMDRFRVKGCELEVVFAQERRKTPNEMRGRVVNQNNHDGSGGGGDRGFERSSSFERHKQHRRDQARRSDRENRPSSARPDDTKIENSNVSEYSEVKQSDGD